MDAHASILAAGTDLDLVLGMIAQGAIAALPQATGAVIEVREGDELVYRAASGTAAHMIGLRLPIEASLSGLCLLSGQAQLCMDSEVDGRVDREACRATETRSMVAVPIPFQENHFGVLIITSRDANAFGPGDVLTARLLIGPIAFGLACSIHHETSSQRDRLAQRLEATFDQAAVGMAHVAPDGRFLRVNRRFADVTGRSADTLYDCTFQDITHPDDLDADIELLEALVAGAIDHYQMEKRYIQPDLSLVWVNLTVSMVAFDDGSPDFFVAVIEDISKRKSAEVLATHDPLTGLPNRRAMLDNVSKNLEKLSGGALSFSVAYLDLDRFKQVNDRLGHAVGDQCLMTVSRLVSAAIRQNDSVYRIAGDEFVLLMPDAKEDVVDQILVRLQNALSEESKKWDWQIGISAGAVILPAGKRFSVDEVLEAADKLMYGVKGRGINARMVRSVTRDRSSLAA